MRKMLALLLAALLLGAAGLTYAAVRVSAPREDVRFEERVVSGDPALADGLQLQVSSTFRKKLLWQSSVDFSEDGYRSQTGYRFFRTGYPETADTPDCSISIWNELDSIDPTSTERSAQTGLSAAFHALYEKTPAGASAEQDVRLADYYTFYPLQIEISLPGGTRLHSNPLLDEPSISALEQAFQIPVLPNEYYRISLRKEADGLCSEAGYQTLSDENGLYDRFDLYTRSVCAGDALYFVFSSRTYQGRQVDLSRLPYGWGVFRLPLGRDDVQAEQLSVCCPLPEDAELVLLNLNEDRTRLLLFTIEDGGFYLRVLDASDGRMLQLLRLRDFAAEDSWYRIEVAEGCVYLCFADETRILQRTQDGLYALWGAAARSELERTAQFGPNQAYQGLRLAFDGERLALAGRLPLTYGDWWDAEENCGFFLAVYTPQGLGFYAEYASGLQAANAALVWEDYNWRSLVRPVLGSLQLTFS